MNPKVVAQARRLYHHVLHGGTLRPEDVSFMIEALEEAEKQIAEGEEHMSAHHDKYCMNIEFPDRYEEQHMKTIQLVDEQVEDIVIQELKSIYDGLANNVNSRLNGKGFIYMDKEKHKDIAIMRDLMRSVSGVLDYYGVQYGE